MLILFLIQCLAFFHFLSLKKSQIRRYILLNRFRFLLKSRCLKISVPARVYVSPGLLFSFSFSPFYRTYTYEYNDTNAISLPLGREKGLRRAYRRWRVELLLLYQRRALISKSEGCSRTVTTLHQTRSVTAKRDVRRLRSILPGVPLRSLRVFVTREFGINRSCLRPPTAPFDKRPTRREGGSHSGERFYGVAVGGIGFLYLYSIAS